MILEPTAAPSVSEKRIAGEDVFNCLQKRMDAVCSEVSEGVYPFARKSDAFADWYCYAGFDDDLEISNECILWAGRPKAPCTPFMLDGHDTVDFLTDSCLSDKIEEELFISDS